MNTMLPVKFIKMLQQDAVIFQRSDEMELEFGFLRDTIRAVPQDNASHSLKLVDDWLAETTPDCQDFSRTTLIFHVARCGSTLLCQNLKATGRYLVLGEPSFLGAMMSDEPECASIKLAKAVSEWQDFAENQGQKLVIKTSSGTSIYQEFLLAALPNVKLVLLVREPVAALESLTRKPPKYVSRDLDELPLALKPFSGFSDLDLSQMSTRATVHYTICMARMLAIHCDYKIVDYQTLPTSFAAIDAYCDGSRNQHTSIEWDAKNYAKKGSFAEAVPYVPKSQADLDDFAKEHVAEIAAAQSVYAKLHVHARELFL